MRVVWLHREWIPEERADKYPLLNPSRADIPQELWERYQRALRELNEVEYMIDGYYRHGSS